jgi:hypothetical protein
MTRSLQLFSVLLVHVLFCILYLFFGVDSQKFADGTIEFNFGRDAVYGILSLALITIFAMFAAFITPLKFVFSDRHLKAKRVQGGFYLITIPFLIFLFYKIISSGFNYGIMATQREQFSFMIELRVIPYLLFIQYVSKRRESIPLLFKVLATGIVIGFVFFQARSLLVEVVIIMLCLKLRKTNDKFSIKYYIFGFLLVPISNIAVAVRSNYSFEKYLEEMFKFEYLIIFNNIVAATLNYNYDDKLNWVLERIFILIPSPIRRIMGVENPSNDMFLEVSAAADLTAGGFSYIANSYLIFGNYAFIVLYILYLVLEILRRNYYYFKIDNYLAYAYPIMLSYVLLAIRNDLGVLYKQVIQLILLAMIMNMISRMVYRA